MVLFSPISSTKSGRMHQRIRQALDEVAKLINDSNSPFHSLAQGRLENLLHAIPEEEDQEVKMDKLFKETLGIDYEEKLHHEKIDPLLFNPQMQGLRNLARKIRNFLNVDLLKPDSHATNPTKIAINQNENLRRLVIAIYKRYIDFCIGIDQGVSKRIGDWLNTPPEAAHAATTTKLK